MSTAQNVHVTVDVREGVFSYMGKRRDGSANWRFLRRDSKRGRLRPGKIPHRMQRILASIKRKEKEARHGQR